MNPQTFTITTYQRSKDWSGTHGPMKDHYVNVRGEDGFEHQNVCVTQKPDTPAPTVGQEVYGHLEAGNYGQKLKKDQQPGGGGGGRNFKPRDPNEIAAIQRQHSQEMALRFLAVNPKAFAAVEKAKDALEEVVRPLVDWFQRDVATGVALAASDALTKQAYGQRRDSEQMGQSDVPSEASGFDHGPVSDPSFA